MQQFRIDPLVTDHHVRAVQQFGTTQRQEPGVARAGADQIDHAFWFHLALLYAVSQCPAMEQRSGGYLTRRAPARIDKDSQY